MIVAVARGDLLGAVELDVLGELDDEILGLEVDLHRIGIELATLLAGLDGLSDLRLDLGDPFITFARIG